jgi:hypothetical protein
MHVEVDFNLRILIADDGKADYLQIENLKARMV